MIIVNVISINQFNFENVTSHMNDKSIITIGLFEFKQNNYFEIEIYKNDIYIVI